ncbi:MAG: integrase family protein [Betaproteobacteria bacterium]|nr:integrase family protein [Betaproteobacteria bacterium]
MKQENFTAERVAGFKFKPSKTGKNNQTVYWDGKAPGLGLRVTPAGAKAFIFETKLNGQTIRMTIGDSRTWGIGKAQKEAARLKTMTDQGIDPRQVIADAIAAKEAKAAALVLQEARETVTVGTAWGEYIKATKSAWGALHLLDHEKAMQAGGEKRTRSKMLTAPGALASLATVRLVDITPELLAEWAKVEGVKRPARTRNARTLFSTFLNWCAAHPTYKAIVTSNAAQSTDVRKHISKAKPKNDALQREQLPAWFAAVKQIGNPAISAYVQAMLLTGARPNELVTVRWADVDFQWNSLTIKDKVEGLRVIPLTPYVAHLIAALPRRNEWVFSSLTSASGHLVEPRIAHDKACDVAGLDVTLHGLRRSFASLCEWIEMPAGIGAQIQGHKPQGVREQHYIRRPLDLLRMWHVKIEAWILNEAGIQFVPVKAGLHAVK